MNTPRTDAALDAAADRKINWIVPAGFIESHMQLETELNQALADKKELVDALGMLIYGCDSLDVPRVKNISHARAILAKHKEQE